LVFTLLRRRARRPYRSLTHPTAVLRRGDGRRDDAPNSLVTDPVRTSARPPRVHHCTGLDVDRGITGEITADVCCLRHRHQEFLTFLKKVAAAHLK
jgi:hypothetical protein